MTSHDLDTKGSSFSQNSRELLFSLKDVSDYCHDYHTFILEKLEFINSRLFWIFITVLNLHATIQENTWFPFLKFCFPLVSWLWGPDTLQLIWMGPKMTSLNHFTHSGKILLRHWELRSSLHFYGSTKAILGFYVSLGLIYLRVFSEHLRAITMDMGFSLM